jgi:hypothetical protein
MGATPSGFWGWCMAIRVGGFWSSAAGSLTDWLLGLGKTCGCHLWCSLFQVFLAGASRYSIFKWGPHLVYFWVAVGAFFGVWHRVGIVWTLDKQWGQGWVLEWVLEWYSIRAGSAPGPGTGSGVVPGVGPRERGQVLVQENGTTRHGCWRSGAVPLVQGLVLSDTWLVTCDLASSQVVKMQKRQSPEHWRTASKKLVHLLWRRASVDRHHWLGLAVL